MISTKYACRIYVKIGLMEVIRLDVKFFVGWA